jgi:hypothetical protein
MEGGFSLTLGNGSDVNDTVDWSNDQRIAVLSSDTVYILTLKGPHFAIKHGSPPVSIATIPLPLSMAPVTTPTKLPGTMFKLFSHTHRLDPFLDSKMNGSTARCFIAARWSPCGCGQLNRCVLTCLTDANNILIYAPPNMIATQWELLLDLTSVYLQLLIQVNFNIDVIGNESTTESSTNRPKTTSNIIKDYLSHQELLVTTSLSWLPRLVTGSSSEERRAILATSNRAGYILIWSFDTPLSNDVVPRIVNVIKLAVVGGWPSSMEWHDGSYDKAGYMLSVGCSSGQLFMLQWEELETRPKVVELWTIADDMSINHLKWMTHQVNGTEWLVYSKGPYLMGIVFTDEFLYSSMILLPANHQLPISGLAITNNNNIISCSIDGTVQSRSLPIFNDEIGSATPIDVGVTRPVSFTGLSISTKGLYICLFANVGKYKIYGQFMMVAGISEDRPFEQLETDICSWDMYEYIRRKPGFWVESREVEPPLPLMMERMISLIGTDDEDRIKSIGTELMTNHSRNIISKYNNHTKEIVNHTSYTISLVNLSHLLSQSANPFDHLLSANLSLPKTSFKETCPICKEVVPFTSFDKDACSNGHLWSRCVLSLRIITGANHLIQCTLCDSKALSEQHGLTWLQVDTCPLCGGYFEPVV